jgi:hypothetical protein
VPRGDKSQVDFVVFVPALPATKWTELHDAFCAHFSLFALGEFGQQLCEFSKSTQLRSHCVK